MTERINSLNAIASMIINGKRHFSIRTIPDEDVPRADIERGTIFTPALPPIINPEIDDIVRAKAEHEAGHLAYTPGNKKDDWTALKGNIVNALEDERIERLISQTSDAFRQDLQKCNRTIIERLNKKMQDADGDASRAVNDALLALHIEGSKCSVGWELSREAQELYDVAKPIYTQGETAETFADVERITDAVIAAWEKFYEDNPGRGEAQGGEAQDGEAQGGEAQDGEAMGGEAQDGEAQGGEAQDGEAMDGEAQDGAKSRAARQESKSGKSEELADHYENESGDAFENIEREIIEAARREAGESFGGYTADTSKDIVRPARESKEDYDTARDGFGGTISRLAGYLASALKTKSRARIIGQRERGKLDLRPAALVSIATGTSKNVFSQKIDGISLDTAVSILVDESGSMYNSRNLNAVRKITIAFSEIMERLGIKHEIIGHTTTEFLHDASSPFSRAAGMLILEHKRFNESYRAAKYRIGGIGAFADNVDGEALLTAWKRLNAVRAKRHIIFVISDGAPLGCCTRKADFDGLNYAVKFVREQGTEVYAFGLYTRDPEQFYGEENFIHVPDIDSVGSEFFNRITKILTR